MSTQKAFFNFKYLFFFLVLLISLICTAATIAECDGTWQQSSALVCTTSTVCAEWDAGGIIHGSCCIAPEHVGTSNFGACEGPLVQ